MSVPHSAPEREPAPTWWVAGSLAVALAAAAPLFLDAGFLNTRSGGDSPFLLFRLHQLVVALQDGIFPVRWMPDAAFGLGYPFFSYYAALPYYLAASLRLAGLSYVLSLKLTHLLGFAVAAWAVWAWIQEITGNRLAGLAAAAVYTWAPFHLVNVFVRGDSLAEFWAMAWYPLILLTLQRVMQEPSARRMAEAALAYGALVMTHNVSALIFSPFAALYVLTGTLAPGQSGALRRLLPAAAAGLLGLALAAWIWLPALAEQSFVQLGEQTTGYFFYGNHFRGVDLVQTRFLFDYDTGHPDRSPFSMGLVQASVAAAGVAVLVIRLVRQRAHPHTGFLLAGLAISTLMMTPISEPIWAHVPLLPFAQFPWRFLSVQALFTAGSAAALIPAPPAPDAAMPAKPVFRAWRYLPAVLAAGITAMMAAAGLGALHLDFVPIGDGDITPQRLQWYESFSGNIGTTIRYEYLPRWTTPRPYTSDILLGRTPRAKFMEGAGTARLLVSGAASQQWEVTVSSPNARVALPVLYWPGWRASMDGQMIPVSPLEGVGYSQLAVPTGEHIIQLRLGHTPVRLGAEAASLAALIGLIGLLHPTLPRWSRAGWAWAAGLTAALLGCSLWLQTRPQSPGLDGPLNADFGQEAFLHPAPAGIALARGERLIGFSLTLDGLTPRAQLNWSSDPPDSVEIDLAAPPQQNDQGSPIYRAGQPAPALLPGLYFPRLVVPGNPALTSSGRTRGDLFMAPVVVAGGPVPRSMISVEARFAEVALRAIEVDQMAEAVYVWLLWEALAEAPRHYLIALRLIDEAGVIWASLDTQTGGAGLYPTGLWEIGEMVPDGYRLATPPGLPPGAYRLQIVLYEAGSLHPLGETITPRLILDQATVRDCPADDFLAAEGLRIQGAALPDSLVQGDPLAVEVGWLASTPPDPDVRALWTLSSEEDAVWQSVTPLAPGSDTRLWQVEDGSCSYVIGRHALEVPGSLPPGDYTLAVQIVDAAGRALGPVHRLRQITITGRDRVFTLPDREVDLEILFGNQLKLWGYTLEVGEEALEMQVVWGAAGQPTADYKYFVHLFDPTTERIVSQVDAMPLAYSYPTTRWMDSEVIEETISLDLQGVPPGDYRLAVGWYDPATAARLPAAGADGSTYPDGRVVLPGQVSIP